MPILHTQFEGEIAQPDGTRIAAPPPLALIRQGPVVQVSFGLAQSLATELTQHGLTLPNPTSGYALIDTGASATCIDDQLAQQMRLPAIDVVQMTSASHAATPANVYPIQMEIIGTPIRVEISRAMGANLSGQKLVALIGRDFLSHCTLFYNGFTGQITLAI